MIASCIALSTQSNAIPGLSLVLDPESALQEIRAVQRLETNVNGSDDRLPYPALYKTDSQLPWCTDRWPYQASINCVAVYHKIARPVEQRGQHSAPGTVCAHVLTSE